MANYTARKLADAQVPLRTAANTVITHRITAITNIVASLTETIHFFDLPKGVRWTDATLRIDGALNSTGTASLAIGSDTVVSGLVTGASGSARTTSAGALLATESLVAVTLGTTNTENATGVIEVTVVCESAEYGLST